MKKPDGSSSGEGGRGRAVIHVNRFNCFKRSHFSLMSTSAYKKPPREQLHRRRSSRAAPGEKFDGLCLAVLCTGKQR